MSRRIPWPCVCLAILVACEAAHPRPPAQVALVETVTLADTGQPFISPTFLRLLPLEVADRAPLEGRIRPTESTTEVIVKFRQDPTYAPKHVKAGPAVLVSSGVITTGHELIYRFEPGTFRTLSAGETAVRLDSVLHEVRVRADVEYAQPNYIQRPFESPSPDSQVGRQWSLENNGNGPGETAGGINLGTAWRRGTGDRRVVVAILDTGILTDHPDVVGSPNLLAGYDMVSDSTNAGDGNGRDGDPTDPGYGPEPGSSHGILVAGIVGIGRSTSRFAGINQAVGILPVRIMGEDGGTTADIDEGIRWAVGMSIDGLPRNPHPARIINMSFGARVPCSQAPATQAAIDDAVSRGAIVVVAAGNDNQDAAEYTPAGCRHVVTVAASDLRGALASYSNSGGMVTILAPGGDHPRADDGDNPSGIVSLVRGGYGTMVGTSMAAAHVTGVLALWLSHADMDNTALIEELRRRASPRTPLQCPRPCGAGLLNAADDDDAARPRS